MLKPHLLVDITYILQTSIFSNKSYILIPIFFFLCLIPQLVQSEKLRNRSLGGKIIPYG